MRCPICGAKMIDGKVCGYCNITSHQVLSASNDAAKKAFKQGNAKDVCYTNKLPSDVDKKKLVLLTMFLGLFGAGNFYVGKRIKGFFCCLSTVFTFIFGVIFVLAERGVLGGEEIFYALLRFFTFFLMINIIMWIIDIVNLMFNAYKVPVILGEPKSKYKHHSVKR